jgi:hypothetical protein
MSKKLSMSAKAAAKPASLDEFMQLLRPGQSLELLKALHILTPDGRLNQDSRRKLKQVVHLYQFIEKVLLELQSERGPTYPLSLADMGAGKSYLGFLVYDLYFKSRDQGQVIAIESRAELVEASRQLAYRLYGTQATRMHFVASTVAHAAQVSELPDQVDVVTALHACDTATDEAIAFGLSRQARAMVLVPCCQALAARLMSQSKALALSKTPLAELWRHPLHTREMGSQVTNVLRCLFLEANGYQVAVTELVGWEHSMKNELIVARYTGQKKRSARERLDALVAQFGLQGYADDFLSFKAQGHGTAGATGR